VFALLTHLLSGDGGSVERFFDAARWYYRCPILGLIDIPLWRHVELLLKKGKPPLARHPRVVATPHIGAATVEAQEAVGEEIVRLLLARMGG